jgi:hypothetical protein
MSEQVQVRGFEPSGADAVITLPLFNASALPRRRSLGVGGKDLTIDFTPGFLPFSTSNATTG